MKKSLRFTYLSMLLLMVSCIGNQTLARRRPPKWVTQRPVDITQYIGIGMAKKTGNEDSYMQMAKNNALNDLCSEISVTISSNSILHQIDNNNVFKEQFEAKTRTSLRQDLEGYEMVGSWYNKKTHEYWVYYRLSKSKYDLQRILKLNKVKKLAQSYLVQARNNEKRLDIHNALAYYAKAIDAIKDHLDEDLSVMTLEGRKNLGSDIYNSIQNIFKRTQFTAHKKRFQIDISSELKDPLLVDVAWLGNQGLIPLAKMPVRYSFSKGDGIINQQVTTNEQGLASSTLVRVTSKQKLQEIQVGLDLESILGDSSANKELNSLFFTRATVPSTKIILNVQRLTAFLKFEENIFGSTSSRQILKNNFKKELSENFFSFTNKENEAKVILNIRTNVTKGEIKEGRNYKVFIVYLDCFLSLTDAESGMEIFNDALYEIKGMKPISYDYAVKEAYEEVIDEIHSQIIPKLSQLDL